MYLKSIISILLSITSTVFASQSYQGKYSGTSALSCNLEVINMWSEFDSALQLERLHANIQVDGENFSVWQREYKDSAGKIVLSRTLSGVNVNYHYLKNTIELWLDRNNQPDWFQYSTFGSSISPFNGICQFDKK